MSLNRPVIADTLWKTPSATLLGTIPQERTPLLSYPVVFRQVLQLLDYWDLKVLIAAGNVALTDYLRRSCTKMNVIRLNKISTRQLQPVLKRDPFDFALGFPHLTTLSIINQSWIPGRYGQSPLYKLPASLRHFTLWTGEVPSIDHAQFAFVPYPTLFPQLETLRLCIIITTAQADASAPQPFTVDMIPPNIRTLSLVIPWMISNLQALEICQPIRKEFPVAAQNKDHTTAATLQHQNLGRMVPHAAMSHEAPEADLIGREEWKYRFESLEFFEWSCSNRQFGPVPAEMPPSLRHYVHHSSYKAHLVALPSRRITRSNETLNNSGLLSFILGSERLPSALPQSITHLTSSQVGFDPEYYQTRSLPLRFPYLRVFEIAAQIDTNEVQFPDTLESLSLLLPEGNKTPLFSTFAPPASLTHLSIAGFRRGPLKGLPATLLSLNISSIMHGAIFRDQVVPFLPKQLRSLRVTLSDFPPEYLRLLPRGLEELIISAESLVMSDWKPEEEWSTDPVEFNVTGIPPNLKHLTLHTQDYRLRFPASMLAILPKSLNSLCISIVLLDSANPDQTPHDAAPSSSSSSSGILEFFGSIAKKFTSQAASVAPEAIENALAMLPSDCWCKIGFKVDIEGDSTRTPKKQPSDLLSSVRQFLPIPHALPSDYGRYLTLQPFQLRNAAAPYR